MMPWSRSLAARLAVLATIWVAGGLLAGWLFAAGMVARHVERALEGRLIGLLDAVVAAAAIAEDGTPTLGRTISEPRFDQPFSGLYWQIDLADGRLATSRSLWDQRLPRARDGHAPELHFADAPGPRGQRMRLVERDITLPEAAGHAHVRVAIDRREIEDELATLERLLAGLFALLGVGLVAAVAVQVGLGLAPLRRLRARLAEVRTGARAALDLAAPREVRPLIEEIDALIAQNRQTVERARGHVGNLAHALKTPLAVLRNALDRSEGPDLAVARRELLAIERLASHHLARARAAAAAGASAQAVDVATAAGELAEALRRIYAERDLSIAITAESRVTFRGERQDLMEMLGNLMENACKWATRRIAVEARATVDGGLLIRVGDDGPGLTDAQRAAATTRGARFDEQMPGTGLGLAIVADLARLYGGALALASSDLGGLEARLTLRPGR